MFVITVPPSKTEDGTASMPANDDSEASAGTDVLVSSDIITKCFVCDIAACQGRCCEEGNAGAPITLDELAYIEEQLDTIWPQLSARAQSVIDKQGVAYTDPEGELVTSVIDVKTPTGSNGNCVFRGPHGCLLAQRPISCHLYPIREKHFGDVVALNYDRWNICHAAVKKGRAEGTPIYKFLREPLVRRFGQAWYDELCDVADKLIIEN